MTPKKGIEKVSYNLINKPIVFSNKTIKNFNTNRKYLFNEIVKRKFKFLIFCDCDDEFSVNRVKNNYKALQKK